jgi:hypothetical protein
MISRILTRLAVALLVLIGALVLIVWGVGTFDPDLHGLFGWLTLLSIPTLLLALAWVFAPKGRP